MSLTGLHLPDTRRRIRNAYTKQIYEDPDLNIYFNGMTKLTVIYSKTVSTEDTK